MEDITDKKKAEIALRESEEKYRRIVNTAIEGVLMFDKNIIITYVNPQMAEMLGYKPEELINQPLTSIVYKDELADYKKKIKNRMDGLTERFERRMNKKDGSIVWVTISASAIIDPNEGFQGSVSMLTDITERKKAESQLKYSEERFRLAFETNPDSININRLEDGMFIDVNQGFVRATGYTREDVIGHTSIEINIWDNIDDRNKLIKELKERGRCDNLEAKFRYKDGKIISGLMSAALINFNGIMHIISITRNITERKTAEEALKKSEERLKKLLNSVTDYIYNVKIENGIVTETNHGEGCIAVTGYSTEEFNDDKYLWYRIVHEDDREVVREHASIIAQNTEVPYLEHRIVHKNGSVRWVRNTPVLHHSPEGKLIGYDGLIADITERKIVEEKLKQNEHLLKRIVESNPNTIYIYELPVFKSIFFNHNIWEALGFVNEQSDEMLLQTIQKNVHPDDWQMINEHFTSYNNAKESDVIEFEFCIKRPNGQWSWLRNKEVIFNKSIDGKSMQILGTATDITEQKETERKILNATIDAEERERNYFARELHDGLGPMLSSIKLYFQWLNKPELQTPKEEIFTKADAIINEAITSVKEISHKLSPHLLMNFGLIFAVKSFIENIKVTSPIQIIIDSNIEQRFDKDIEATLYRVIIECINNTLKYASANNITINLMKTSNQIAFEYTDDGIGFNYDEISKSGKGLGLFNMQNRVTILGGNFVIENPPEKGVKIKVSINI